MKMRFPRWAMAAALAMAAGASGCSTMNNTEKDATVGGLAGAGVGAVAGSLLHAPVLGAAVGGLAGTGVGAAIGSDKDAQVQRQQNIQYATAVANAQAQANANRLGMTEVIQMSRDGQSDQVIINQIRNTGSTFQLSVADLNTLKVNNVPPSVIAEMQNARPTTVVVGAPQPPVVYQAAPVPPVVVWGRPYGYYGGYRRGWGW
ncbi:MAG TPA: hypothetical protein VGI99_12770 [Gemmataceae bacterium]